MFSLAHLLENISGVISLPNFCNMKSVQSISLKVLMGNEMKLDALREGSEKKNIVQEPKPFHK